tara:strand:- start:100214 stop:100414 length:201 start_codon:yes stop_codon:yes gene_type:complete
MPLLTTAVFVSIAVTFAVPPYGRCSKRFNLGPAKIGTALGVVGVVGAVSAVGVVGAVGAVVGRPRK